MAYFLVFWYIIMYGLQKQSLRNVIDPLAPFPIINNKEDKEVAIMLSMNHATLHLKVFNCGDGASDLCR